MRESELRRMIAESVNKILNEIKYKGVSLHGDNPEDWNIVRRVRQEIGDKEYERCSDVYSKHLKHNNKRADSIWKTFDKNKRNEIRNEKNYDDMTKNMNKQDRNNIIDKSEEKVKKILKNG